MPETSRMDRNLALEAVRVTEAAALSASRLMGRGDEKAADQAAVDAMREALNSLAIDGTVVIGEGERDEAPMLYIGEKVGTGNGPPIDIALDPLEGTTITAKGGANALAVIAMADAGGFPQRSRRLYGQDRGRRRAARRSRRSRRAAGSKSENLAQREKGRGRRSGGLHPRPAASCRSDRQGARGRRSHRADLGWRCQRRHRHVEPGDRDRHVCRLGRRARRRAGGGGVALHRRANAGAAAVPQR